MAENTTHAGKARRRTTLIGIALIILLSAGLLGAAYQGQPRAQPLKIGIIAYPGFAPFFVAQEKGFFEKEGVQAEVVLMGDPTTAISSLASDDVQILFSSADFSTIVEDGGIEIKEIFASDIGYGSDGLLVKSDINTLADLKGQTVYLSLGTPSHFLLRFLAQEAGLSPSDLRLVHMEADQVGAAFVSGNIDYGMSWEPWLSKAAERGDGKVLVSSKERPGIITDTFAVRADTLRSRRDEVKRVVRAWFDAIEFWKTSPTEANQIMANHLGLSSEDFASQVVTVKFLDYRENLAKFDTSQPLNIFELTERAVAIYTEDGILRSAIKANDIVDPSILAELYE